MSGAINGGAYILTSGTIATTNTTASTSSGTGALRSSGGCGIAGDVNVGGAINATGNIISSANMRASATTASTSTTTGALRSNGGLGVAGNAYIGGNVYAPTFTGDFYGVYSSVQEAQALTSTSNFSVPAYFKELDIVIRDISVSVASAQIRIALRAGTVALTHAGVSAAILAASTTNTAWNAGYMILNAPAAAEFAHYRINVKALSVDATQYNYLVTGTGYNSYPYTISMIGSVGATSQIDNIQFSASSGVFDNAPKIWIQAIL